MCIIDLSQQLPGPYATALLRQLGARVIKVEPPSGDPSRDLDPHMFARVNRGKESVALDLKTDTDRRYLHALVSTADVVLEGFRPGVTAGLAADWSTLSQINPRLVHCSVSGFGQQGPHAQTPAHDLNFQGLAGVVDSHERSHRIGVPWVDLGTATTAALSIVAAWHEARKTGRGRHLDIAMVDVAVAWGAVKDTSEAPVQPTYGVFSTADGRGVVVAILEDHFWSRLCDALGWDDWTAESRLATYGERLSSATEIHERLAHELGARPLADVLRIAGQWDLPITVLDPDDDHRAAEQLHSRGLTGRDVRLPVTPSPVEGEVPALGAHTSTVLAELASDDSAVPHVTAASPGGNLA